MKYSKNKALTILTMGMAAVSCTSQSAKQEDKRPNILFIMSDDHAYQAISAYGHGLNETPNIDRLAKEGAIFTRACVTNSLSAPSRAVLLTGKHSFVNGKVDNVQPFDWDQPNFPKLLQADGYQTAMIGKIHLDGIPQGFDYSMVLPGQEIITIGTINGEKSSQERVLYRYHHRCRARLAEKQTRSRQAVLFALSSNTLKNGSCRKVL